MLCRQAAITLHGSGNGPSSGMDYAQGRSAYKSGGGPGLTLAHECASRRSARVGWRGRYLVWIRRRAAVMLMRYRKPGRLAIASRAMALTCVAVTSAGLPSMMALC